MERTGLITYFFEKTTHFAMILTSLIQTSWYVPVFAGLLAFFEPVQVIIHLLIFAVMLDLASGLIKTIVKKQRITSWRLRDTPIKLFFYVGLILLVYGLQTTCLYDLPAVNIVAAIMLFAEAISVAENTDEILNRKTGVVQVLKQLKSKYLKNDKNTN
jgi:hypothetical protein